MSGLDRGEPVPRIRPSEIDQTAFVDREAELERLKDHLNAVASGEGGVVLLAGEAGVGKTALVRQLVQHASAGGGAVLLGRCRGPSEGSYAPVADALSAFAAQRDTEELRASLGPSVGGLARLLPEVAERLAAPSDEPASLEEERFRLFRAVAALLGGAPAPVLLVIEDLQDADAGTLLIPSPAVPRGTAPGLLHEFRQSRSPDASDPAD